MNDIALYMHAGSGNHGCEAIVDSLTRMLDEKITLVTYSSAEDKRYLPKEVTDRLDIEQEQDVAADFITHCIYYARRKLTGDKELFLRYRLAPISSMKVKNAAKDMQEGKLPKVAVSIGGDNYCYDMMVGDLMLANSMLNRQGTKTILLGCSVEPGLLKRKEIIEDMKRYSAIIARESITYNALLENGVPKEKVFLVPDPAFTLPSDESALPEGFESGNTVGINLSPMVESYAKDKDIALNCYRELIKHILDTTNMKIALIPHVIWSRSDDRIPLTKLYNEFRDTKRVTMIEDLPAEKLKGIIANCRFFVGSRTHATIAAYSTLVPTLVIGYSVKARGIANDLFGKEEHYVLPVQVLEKPEDLVKEYDWLYKNEDQVRYELAGAIPFYIKKANESRDIIHDVLEQGQRS